MGVIAQFAVCRVPVSGIISRCAQLSVLKPRMRKGTLLVPNFKSRRSKMMPFSHSEIVVDCTVTVGAIVSFLAGWASVSRCARLSVLKPRGLWPEDLVRTLESDAM